MEFSHCYNAYFPWRGAPRQGKVQGFCANRRKTLAPEQSPAALFSMHHNKRVVFSRKIVYHNITHFSTLSDILEIQMKKFLLILLICLLIYAAALSYDFKPPEAEITGPAPAQPETPKPDPTPAPAADTPRPTPSPTPSPTPAPTATPAPTPSPMPEPTELPAKGSYYITVNVQANTVTVYTLDDDGY